MLCRGCLLLKLFCSRLGLGRNNVEGRNDLDAQVAVAHFEVRQNVAAGDDKGEGLDIVNSHIDAHHAVEVVRNELTVEIDLYDV